MSKGRAILLLFLFSDVGRDDAPTRILAGSHLDMARALVPYGEDGQHVEAVADLDLPGPHRLEYATGSAGDVFICHPFLVHAATWPHRGATARFLSQPGLVPATGQLELDRPDGDHSPVERAVLLGRARSSA